MRTFQIISLIVFIVSIVLIQLFDNYYYKLPGDSFKLLRILVCLFIISAVCVVFGSIFGSVSVLLDSSPVKE